MHGLTPDYDRIISSMSIKEKGVSVTDLVQAGRENGLALVPLKASVKDLRRFTKPAILHMQSHDESDGESGHFVVLLRIHSDDSATILDSTLGSIVRTPYADMLTQWSGIILVREVDWNSQAYDDMVVTVAFVCLACLVVLLLLKCAGLAQLFFTTSTARPLDPAL